MDKNEQILSLIGLCLRGRNLEVGEEPVEAVARARDARVLLLASDAADNTARRIQRFAEMGQCIWLRVPFTKRDMGRATGRGAAAVAAITDIGLAVAVVRRLAELDPVRYDQDLAKLELKAQRAAERKSEAAQHEKNLRRGIKRSKKQEDQTPKVSRKKPFEDRVDGPQRGSKARKDDSGRTAQKNAQRGGQRLRGQHDGRRPAAVRDRDDRRPAGKGRDGQRSGGKSGQWSGKGGTFKNGRSKPSPYAHSRPVKKGKGSFRKKEN